MTNYTMIQYRYRPTGQLSDGDWHEWRTVQMGHHRAMEYLEAQGEREEYSRTVDPDTGWRTVTVTETEFDRLNRIPDWADQG
jgi:hypothetical protein